jgi:hypothetical protein
MQQPTTFNIHDAADRQRYTCGKAKMGPELNF